MRKSARRAFAAAAAMLVVGALGLFGCSSSEGEPSGDVAGGREPVELQVFAANSLSKAMEEAQALYVEQNPHVTFADTQYLGSGDLNAQLQAGAYADLLISASSGKMDDAAEAARAAGAEPPQSLEALAKRCDDEPALLEAVRESARMLAAGLYSIMCSSGIRRIVLGGGIEALGAPFLDEVERALYKRSLLIRTVDLSYAQAGPDAEILGVAEHYLDKVFTITT